MKIDTAFGKKTVVRRVGVAGEYYETLPSSNEPNGAWWVLNPQRGFVPIASNGHALRAAIEYSNAKL